MWPACALIFRMVVGSGEIMITSRAWRGTSLFVIARGHGPVHCPLKVPCAGGRVSGYDALLLAGGCADACQICSVDRVGWPCACGVDGEFGLLALLLVCRHVEACAHEGAFAAVVQDVYLAAISVGDGAPVIQRGAGCVRLLHVASIRQGASQWDGQGLLSRCPELCTGRGDDPCKLFLLLPGALACLH